MSGIRRVFFQFTYWRRLFIGIGFVYLAVSLSVGGTRSAKAVFQGLAASWIMLLTILQWRRQSTGSVVSASPHPQPSRWQSLESFTEIITWNFLLVLVLAELTLRAYSAMHGTSLVLSTSLEAHRLKPGQDYGAGLRGNHLGYPGRDFQEKKSPGRYRIAALGDSFAVGPAVPFHDNYLTILESKLRGIEVYNFGVSGAGPREYHTILQEHVWRYNPDLVLVSVFIGNDITENLPMPRYLDPRQHSLYLLLTRGYHLLKESGPTNSAWTSSPDARLQGPPMSAKKFREVEARRLAVCYRRPPAGMDKKWQRALHYLEQIIDVCRQRQVALRFVLIPDEFQVNPSVLAQAITQAGVRPAEIDLDLPQRKLGNFFRSKKVPSLDLLPDFRKLPATYAIRDTHWNVAGNRLAAGIIADWVRKIN